MLHVCLPSRRQKNIHLLDFGATHTARTGERVRPKQKEIKHGASVFFINASTIERTQYTQQTKPTSKKRSKSLNLAFSSPFYSHSCRHWRSFERIILCGSLYSVHSTLFPMQLIFIVVTVLWLLLGVLPCCSHFVWYSSLQYKHFTGTDA